MKSIEELTANLFKRRDQYNLKKKKQNKIIVAVVSLCLVVVIGFGAWKLDLFKTPPIDTTPDETVSNVVTQSSQNTPIQSESEPKPPSPIDQTFPTSQDNPTETGGDLGWWFDCVYEYKYVESYYNYLSIMVDREKLNNWHRQFWVVNKNTYTRVESVGVIGAVDELGITKEQFVSAIGEHGTIIDGRYYYSTNIEGYPAVDDTGLDRYWYLTQEEVDLIFSADKELRDQKLRSRYTAYANGEIYTPRWICLHTAEDYIAAGLTKEQMMETVSTWNHVGVPIVVEPNGDVWQDAERFKKVLEYVKIEIDKMP